ncbi:MAG: cupin domain-containing protein, partial [Bacteroidota bacterium]
RLRRARLRLGVSIRDVASSAGLSKTSVVRLEAGEPVRTTTVRRVCEALGLHVGRLADLSDDGDGPAAIHRLEDDRWVDMADIGGGHLLGADRALNASERAQAVEEGVAVPICIIRSRLPGGRVLPSILELYRPSEVRSHPGEEFVHVLSGRARIEVGGEAYELAEGESMTFWSAEPHRYLPAESSEIPTRLLSVRVDG